MSLAALLHRVQKGLSTVELIHTPHSRWPFPPSGPTSPVPSKLHISVLDSSFNPPTLAHLALASLPPPPAHANEQRDFDARLLLLSVRNADKQLKPGDASYEQRAAMMVLLAQDLARSFSHPLPTSSSPGTSAPARDPNIAVAIIDEPSFVGKSSLLLDFLRKRVADLSEHPSPAPKLTFVMGTDTIVRFFAQRYYADEHTMLTVLSRFLSVDGDDSRILCARRAGGMMGEGKVDEVELPSFAHNFVASDLSRIYFADIGERECAYSSSEVRAKVAAGDPSWKALLTESIANFVEENGLYIPS